MLCNIFRTKFWNKFVTKNGPVLPPCKFFLDHRVDDQILYLEGCLWPGGHNYCGSVYDSPGIAVAAVAAVVNNTGHNIKVIIMTLRSWCYLIRHFSICCCCNYLILFHVLIDQMKNSPKVLHHVSSWWQESSETYELLFHVLKHVNLYVS